MGRMSKLLRCLAGLFILCFIGNNAFAAGYNCPTYRKYTSCSSGYYLSDCGTFFNGQTITDPSAGNSCKTCPPGSGATRYNCPGGNKCPSRAMIAAKRITYNLNGGSGTAPASSICMTNPCTLNSGNTNSFYRAGYQLVGWSTDPDAEDGSFSITVSGNTTVYAVWKACTGATYKNSSANASAACSTCPSGYSMGGTALTSINACRMYVNDGQYLAERYSSTTKQCPAGYACLANAINYGTISEERPTYFYQCTGATFSRAGSGRCFDCPSGTSGWTRGEGVGWTDNSSCYQYRNATSISRYCSAGQLRQYGNPGSVGSGWSDEIVEHTAFQADAGAYVSGSGINMTCTRCSGAVYSAGGDVTSCTACPTATSGWTRGTGTGWDSYSDCYQYRNATSISRYCSSGQLRRYASSASAWSSTATESVPFRADPGAYVSGSGINMTCTRCSGATYSAGGDVTSCTACPTATSGWTRGTGTGWDSYSDCYQYRNATSISRYCSSGQLRRYASSASAWSSTATESVPFRAAPGAYVSGSGINMTCTQCTGAVYSAGGDVTSCTACPTTTVSGWNQGTGTGWDSENDCYFYRRATDISSYCAAGELRVTHGQPPDGQTPTAAIVDEYEAFRADPGAIVTGSGVDMTCTQCGVGEYSAGGDVHACTSCPELTPGFVYNTTKGMESYTECVQGTKDPSAVNPYCVATSQNTAIWQQADSPTTWNAVTLAQYIGAAPGAILGSDFNEYGVMVVENSAYDFDNMCTQCGVGTYSAGGNVKECTACPALTPGFEYGAGTGLTSYTECKQFAHDPSEVNPYCMDNASVIVQEAGSPTAWDGSTLAVGVSAAPGAILDSQFQDGAFGIEGAYDFDDMCIPCTGNTYSAGGTATSCTSCNRDYTISGTALTNHDSASDCKITCSGGEYVPTAGDGCVNVGVGYWGAGGTVSQTSTLGRNACASGLTTIGSGLGADEAGDCGRVLNVGDEKIYLRSTKKTTPSLNISINGDVFYGNMSTATKGSLRINSGGTTYSVYDDSM